MATAKAVTRTAEEKDKNYWIKQVSKRPLSYMTMPSSLQKDKEFLFDLFSIAREAIKYVREEEILDDIEFWIKLARDYRLTIINIDMNDGIKKTPEIYLLGYLSNLYADSFFPENLLNIFNGIPEKVLQKLADTEDSKMIDKKLKAMEKLYND